MNKTIGIIGLWHLGSVIAVSWAKLGYKVIGFDYDKKRIENFKQNKPPIFEPGLEDEIKDLTEKGLLSFTYNIKDLSECDFVFLTYDTPVRDDDSSDTSILKKSVKDVRGVMKDNSILIVSSQSPVGYCEELRNLLKKKNKTLELAYSPENLRLGEAIECYLNPGRIILGTASKDTEQKCIELFGKITNDILAMSLESSEMVKHGINSFLSTSIVFANHIADLCEEKGANITDVIKGMKSDVRIGQKAYLAPGIGFSGGTLGRDLKVLETVNNEMDGYAKLFGFIHKTNFERKKVIVKKIEKILKKLKGKNIGILGLTYKPGTSTLRRSLPLEIVDLLIKSKAKVKVFDPKADYAELTFKPKFKIENSIEAVADKSDILVILTDWPDFKNYDWSKIISSMNSKNFLDVKNFLDKKKMKEIGFNFYSLGAGEDLKRGNK
ncbi:MAG TPA: nucleotide sugar dehydrogenase [Ignavibacteria bacterium]|nr:nucleotide sugar dehydrogenase [Ignavibacteria bacterium]